MARVTLSLYGEPDDIVVTQSAPLTDWVWSYTLDGEGSCLVYADSLYFDPVGLTDLTLEVSVDSPEAIELQVVPTIESFAIYLP